MSAYIKFVNKMLHDTKKQQTGRLVINYSWGSMPVITMSVTPLHTNWLHSSMDYKAPKLMS